MIILNLERSSKMPLFRQIFGQLKQLIENHTLKPGFRMPSTRTLAEKHGINRSTVYKAYEELWALGYMESRPGSYSVVRQRQKIATPEQKLKEGLIPWEEKSSRVGRTLHHAYKELKSRFPLVKGTAAASSSGKPDAINFASLDLDPRLFPVEDFRRCINTVLVERGQEILRYGEGAGYKPLREFIAGRLRIHGIAANSNEIIITNGCQNAIELVLKFFTVPGSKVAIETPTYSNVLPLLKCFETDIIGIPMKPGGMDLDHLEQVLKNQDLAFVYSMPNFHNPTGITTDQAHRERLLGLCETYQVPLVEDAFEEEMKYFGKVSLPIKSMDRKQVVVYLGTFSKALFPGIRIGWIAADNNLIQRLEAIKKFSDLSTNTLIQAALHEFCQQGYYDRHIKRMHREYRKRMHTALTTLKEKLPGFDRVSWTEPAGGYLIWLKLQNPGMTEEAVKEVFLRSGVSTMPGTYFYPDSLLPSLSQNPSVHHFRLSISTLDEQEIHEGILRLAKAISLIYGRR
jgi:DNA-binding transcriptional MocR family regulator